MAQFGAQVAPSATPDWQGPGTKREPLFHEWKVRQVAFQSMLSVRASLDAAMSLVPEGWRPLLDSTDSEYSPHWAELYSDGADYPIAKSRGSSLALAICGAALRAQASAEGGE